VKDGNGRMQRQVLCQASVVGESGVDLGFVIAALPNSSEPVLAENLKDTANTSQERLACPRTRLRAVTGCNSQGNMELCPNFSRIS
jgi:hypothetical protein